MRSSLLLVILAFAFGLWLGFNPEAHAKTEQTWKDVKTAFTEFVVKTSKDMNTPKPVTSPNTSAPARDKASNPDQSSKSNHILDQISVALRDLWEALKTLWKDLRNNFPEKKP